MRMELSACTALDVVSMVAHRRCEVKKSAEG